jgi:hypothetical protein
MRTSHRKRVAAESVKAAVEESRPARRRLTFMWPCVTQDWITRSSEKHRRVVAEPRVSISDTRTRQSTYQRTRRSLEPHSAGPCNMNITTCGSVPWGTHHGRPTSGRRTVRIVVKQENETGEQTLSSPPSGPGPPPPKKKFLVAQAGRSRWMHRGSTSI